MCVILQHCSFYYYYYYYYYTDFVRTGCGKKTKRKGKEGGREEGMKGREKERKMKEIQIQATLIIYDFLIFFLRTKYTYSSISLVCAFVYTACTLTHTYLHKHI